MKYLYKQWEVLLEVTDNGEPDGEPVEKPTVFHTGLDIKKAIEQVFILNGVEVIVTSVKEIYHDEESYKPYL